jgi:hypothetical protein
VNPVIIIEGPDGVGKTTLCDALAQRFLGSCTIVHSVHYGPPPGDEPTALYYWDEVDNILGLAKSGPVIVDRFHVGEMVYGPILRGDAGMSLDEACVIDMRLQAIGAMMCHCRLSSTDLSSRLLSRDGGLPDSASGAALGHSEAVRAAFFGMTNGVLPSSWEQLDMTWYPAQLVPLVALSSISLSTFGAEVGVIGNVRSPQVLIKVPNSDMDTLSRVVRGLRLAGMVRVSAIEYDDTDLNYTTVSRSVAMGLSLHRTLMERGFKLPSVVSTDATPEDIAEAVRTAVVAQPSPEG